MSPTSSDEMKNINVDQKMAVLEIFAGVVFALLVLLCFLVYCCRKTCMKLYQFFKNLPSSSTHRGANNDQSTSTSHLSLMVSQRESSSNSYPESSGHEEVVMVDVHVNQGCSVGQATACPVLPLSSSTSLEVIPIEKSLSNQENDEIYISLQNMATFFINKKSAENREGYVSLDKEHSLSAMLSWSLTEKQEQASFQAELSTPHSQQHMQPQHMAAQAISFQHLQEAVTSDSKSEQVVMSESVSIPPSHSDEFLTRKGLKEVGGRKPLPHPQSWFVSLDGHSIAHVRHSYTDLQATRWNGINSSNLDSGNMNERKQQVLYPPKNLNEVDQSGSECGAAVCSPEINAPRFVLDGERSRGGGQLASLQEETKRSVEILPEPLPSTECKITGDREADCHGADPNDLNYQREGNKTPWQKREERPVMTFNVKK